jgi:hypothetical protein
MNDSGASTLLSKALATALAQKYGLNFPTDAAIIAKLVTLLIANLP